MNYYIDEQYIEWFTGGNKDNYNKVKKFFWFCNQHMLQQIKDKPLPFEDNLQDSSFADDIKTSSAENKNPKDYYIVELKPQVDHYKYTAILKSALYVNKKDLDKYIRKTEF